MSDDNDAAPPDGGRMNHDAMRRASERPVTGPAATDAVAASGGLDLPGHAGTGQTADQQGDRRDASRTPPPTAASIEKIEREHEPEGEQS